MPIWLLKACTDELAPLITHIINRSLAQGKVPSSLKKALVKPLIKKVGLDVDTLKNYRPVSNLSFISKLLEKAVAARVEKYLCENGLLTTFQSAYRENHSPETALLKVQSDILHGLDGGSSCILVLLDLSAAFDTIDHRILLKRLSKTFGIKGLALDWFASYLSDRFQMVTIDGHKSQPQLLEYGVPQGSVLGPKLYSLYTKPLVDIMEERDVNYHFFADDGQLYRFFQAKNSDSVSQATSAMEIAVQKAQDWMLVNKLKCNSDKTELLVVSPRATEVDVSLTISGSQVKSSECVRDLGVHYDSHFTMEKHINHICKCANMHLRRIGAIRRHLTEDATKSLVQSLVMSRLDYSNGLLYGLPDILIKKLQRVQNKAARIVTRTPRREHITPILHELHWLPAHRRVQYKVLLYTYKCLNNRAPIYLEELVQKKESTRALRSSQQSKLTAPRSRTRYGDRTFTNASYTLWNALPAHMTTLPNLDCFKRALKTYLFKLEYD